MLLDQLEILDRQDLQGRLVRRREEWMDRMETEVLRVSSVSLVQEEKTVLPEVLEVMVSQDPRELSVRLVQRVIQGSLDCRVLTGHKEIPERRDSEEPPVQWATQVYLDHKDRSVILDNKARLE